MKPAPVAKLQDRQPAEIAESQSTAPSSPPAPQSNPATAAQPQSKHAPGIGAGAPGAGSVASAPAQPVPQGQLAPGISAQQQVQSAPPPQQGADASSSQAAANTTPPAQQAPSTPQPQPGQVAAAAEPQATQPEHPQQSEGEWLKSRGATVRSGPSSSASALTNLDSGVEVRVVARQSGWVQIANSDGSKTGWVYEKLLEPAASLGESAAAGPSEQMQDQSGWVKVLGSPAGMRSSPSQSSPILFAFPEGRELRVVSREPGWVQVKDPGSKQTGWVADTSLVASDGKAKPLDATASTERQQAPSAYTPRRQAASASSRPRQSAPQRRSRDAGPESYENAEGPPPGGRNFVPWEAEMNAPGYVEEREDRPRRWWRRRSGFAFFGRDGGED